PSNWGCGIVPDTTTDVTIPQVVLGNSQPNIFNFPPAFARDLTIEPGASVTTYGGYHLELHGNFTNDGNTSMGIGLVKFGGAVTQHIRGANVIDFTNVEVANRSNSTALMLEQDINVS